jgi:predicted nicotinamide N-methyase
MQHHSLIDSLRRALHPDGTAIFVFSNHIPGMLGEDLSFFEKARASGDFVVSRQEVVKKPGMFSDGLIDMYIMEMKFA